MPVTQLPYAADAEESLTFDELEVRATYYSLRGMGSLAFVGEWLERIVVILNRSNELTAHRSPLSSFFSLYYYLSLCVIHHIGTPPPIRKRILSEAHHHPNKVQLRMGSRQITKT